MQKFHDLDISSFMVAVFLFIPFVIDRLRFLGLESETLITNFLKEVSKHITNKIVFYQGGVSQRS